MRKILTLTLAGVAILALSAAPAFAGSGASCSKGASADKASCTAHGTEAKLISADGKACPQAGKASAAMSAEECAKKCGYEGGKCDMVNMSIKGMTCGGCESSVSSALMDVPGVVKVVSISHKEGTALVCVDPAKVQKDALTTAVSNKGYEVEIIPAVATVASADGKSKACCDKAKVCSAAEKAACEKKEAAAEKTADDTK